MWNANTGLLMATLENHTAIVWQTAFWRRRSRLTAGTSSPTADDKTGRVWNVANGQLLVELEGHNVVQAAFSPDGQHIVTASEDKTAQVFRVVSLLNVDELLRAVKRE